MTLSDCVTIYFRSFLRLLLQSDFGGIPSDFYSFVCCCGWSFPAAFVCLIRYLISNINSIQQSNDIKMTFLSIFLS